VGVGVDLWCGGVGGGGACDYGGVGWVGGRRVVYAAYVEYH